MNCRHRAYTLKVLTPSLSTVEYDSSWSNNLWLKYATGWSSPLSSYWLRTATTPWLEASVWIVYCQLKWGVFSTGAPHKISLSFWNASSHSLVHLTRLGDDFFVMSVKRTVIAKWFGMNLQYSILYNYREVIWLEWPSQLECLALPMWVY